MKAALLCALLSDLPAIPTRTFFFFAAAAGCLLALAIWKESRESWFLSLCGLFVVAAMIKYGDEVGFPLSMLVWGAGFLVLSAGKTLFVGRDWKQTMANLNREFKEYRDARTTPPGGKP